MIAALPFPSRHPNHPTLNKRMEISDLHQMERWAGEAAGQD
jgi:hypothetical protein